MSAPPAPAAAAAAPAPSRPTTIAGHVRAAGVLLLLTVLVTGLAYPVALSAFSSVAAPGLAGGSLLTCPNGTVVGSADVAQNLSAGTLGPSLFWGRPSLTDYNTTLGAATPPGPSDPALLALLNETIAYMRAYGDLTVNATLSYWWVAPSGSSIDPDLVPEAVLVQVPRVAAANNLSVPVVLALVNAHITNPPLPYVGMAYVNVLDLDLALLESVGRC